MTAGRIAAALFIFFAAASRPAAADFATTIANAEVSGVGIKIDSPFENTPTIGVLPVNVEIANYTSSDRSWEMSAEVRPWNSGRVYKRRESFSVPSGQVRVFRVYLDLLNQEPNFDTNSYGMNTSLTFSGPGITSGGYVSFPQASTGWDKIRLPLVGFSPALETSVPEIEVALAAQSLGTFPNLETMLSGNSSLKGYQLSSTKFSLASLPEKWHGYLSMRQLWMTGSELGQLSAPQREALLGWVFQGGSLFLVVNDLRDSSLRQFQIEPVIEDGPLIPFGLGVVTPVVTEARTLAAEDFIRQLKKTPAEPTALIRGETSPVGLSWGLADGIGGLSTAAGTVILIMVGYGILVGPLNILVFARHKRHRLFITTPLIAAAASVLLVVFILLSDGTGGNGNRLLAVLLNPIARTSLTLQEQASRTGLLINRDFSIGEDSILLPIRFDQSASTSPSYTYYNNSDSKIVERSGSNYSGEWFESRALNSHVLGTVESTRSGVDLLTQQGGTPLILSNLKIVLDQFYYRDRDGGIWKAEKVQPGTETPLQAVRTDAELTNWLHDRVEKAGKAIAVLSETVDNRRGYFYAWSSQAESLALATVESISWGTTEALITGPLAERGSR